MLPGEYLSVYEKDGFSPQIKGGIRVAAGPAVRADMELGALGILRGRVLDPEGKPVPDASVKIGALDDEENTDAQGRFEITDLPPGSYSLRASIKTAQVSATGGPSAGRVEVVPTFFPSAMNLTDAELIQIRPGANLDGYDIHLRTSEVYRVRGAVLDETGKPVPKAEVALIGAGENRVLVNRLMFGPPPGRSGYFISQHGRQDVEANTVSANDGSFEFSSVRPGDWSLGARRPNAPPFLANGSQVTISDWDMDGIELRITPPFPLEITADWGGRQPPPPKYRPRSYSLEMIRRS